MTIKKEHCEHNRISASHKFVCPQCGVSSGGDKSILGNNEVLPYYMVCYCENCDKTFRFLYDLMEVQELDEEGEKCVESCFRVVPHPDDIRDILGLGLMYLDEWERSDE